MAERLLANANRKEIREGRTRKARLHRLLLYHLNNLVDEGLLHIDGTQGKGEKLFALAVKEGEVEITSGKKRVVIRKTARVTTPLDDPRMHGLLHAYREQGWAHAPGAVFLRAEAYPSLREATDALVRALTCVTDTAALIGVQKLLAGHDEMEESLARIERTCTQEGHRVTVTAALSAADEERLVRFVRTLSELRPTHIEFVIEASAKDVRAHAAVLTGILPFLEQAELKLHLKNNAIHEAPIAYGDTGTYAPKETDWRTVRVGAAVGGATVAIDVFRARTQGARLRELARTASQALFIVGRERRRELGRLAQRLPGVSFAHMDEYVRFWNYDWREEGLLDEIRAAVEAAQEFSARQERVYRACGMPVRFRLVATGALAKMSGALSARQYRKMMVRSYATLQEESFVAQLRVREELCRIFAGDRVRFFRSEARPDEVVRELLYLLGTYALPFVTYDFSELRGNVKLTEYLRGGEQ